MVFGIPPPLCAAAAEIFMPSRLGQNFLRSRSLRRQIVSLLSPSLNEVIIEIGAGHGELTSELLNLYPANPIIAVEKDRHLAALLIRLFKSSPNLKIIHADILHLVKDGFILPENTSGYSLIGNLPYYLTGRLLRLLGGNNRFPTEIILTVQKEVAARLAPPPAKFNLLAASVSWWGTVQKCLSLSPKEFSPSPQVASAVIKITPRPREALINKDAFYKIIKVAFAHPRKTLANNLASGLKLSKSAALNLIKLIGLKADSRPSDLTYSKIHSLVSRL